MTPNVLWPACEYLPTQYKKKYVPNTSLTDQTSQTCEINPCFIFTIAAIQPTHSRTLLKMSTALTQWL